MKQIILIASILCTTTTHPMLEAIFGAPTKPAAQPAQNQNHQIVIAPQGTMQPAAPQRVGATGAAANNATPLPIAFPPVTVNVNIQNEPKFSNSNQQAQQAQQETVQMSNQYVHQTMTATLKNAIHEGASRASDQVRAFKEWITSNKFKIIAGGACSGYAFLAFYLLRASSKMHDEHLWSRWRIEDSYEQLMRIPQKQLGQDLIFAIQRRYTTSAQFSDFISPLVQFLKDIEEEKKFLKRYIETAKWSGRLRLHRILPVNEKKIELAKKLLERLCFFEHVFLSWAAEFKIQQNT